MRSFLSFYRRLFLSFSKERKTAVLVEVPDNKMRRYGRGRHNRKAANLSGGKVVSGFAADNEVDMKEKRLSWLKADGRFAG